MGGAPLTIIMARRGSTEPDAMSEEELHRCIGGVSAIQAGASGARVRAGVSIFPQVVSLDWLRSYLRFRPQ